MVDLSHETISELFFQQIRNISVPKRNLERDSHYLEAY